MIIRNKISSNSLKKVYPIILTIKSLVDSLVTVMQYMHVDPKTGNTINAKTANLKERDNKSSSLKVTPKVDVLLESSLSGETLSESDCYRLITVEGEEFEALCRAASSVRDKGKGNIISFSP